MLIKFILFLIKGIFIQNAYLKKDVYRIHYKVQYGTAKRIVIPTLFSWKLRVMNLTVGHHIRKIFKFEKRLSKGLTFYLAICSKLTSHKCLFWRSFWDLLSLLLWILWDTFDFSIRSCWECADKNSCGFYLFQFFWRAWNEVVRNDLLYFGSIGTWLYLGLSGMSQLCGFQWECTLMRLLTIVL